jgi:osmotically inducible protein OsmC
MTEKTAVVHWEGQGKNGQGKISTETGALKHYPYGFASRFEDDRRGTNPEEILGAAHAACFTMAFSFACDKAGLATTDVDTKASVRQTISIRPLKQRASPRLPGFLFLRSAG